MSRELFFVIGNWKIVLIKEFWLYYNNNTVYVLNSLWYNIIIHSAYIWVVPVLILLAFIKNSVKNKGKINKLTNIYFIFNSYFPFLI